MPEVIAAGHLSKMATSHDSTIQYQFITNDQPTDLNPLLGKPIQLRYTGNIACCHCGRTTKKSFSQGFCYPCFKKLAQCDTCIMSPERCHYEAGTCREPEWADQFCMTDHIVYLANSSGIKVGITRINQVPTRWMDQGAIAALPILRVATRQQSGLVEDALREFVADKTNWRKMLKGEVEQIDLIEERDRLLELADSKIAELQNRFGIQSIQFIEDSDVYEFNYPVNEHPSKVKTHNLDKEPLVEGVLQGIKGQYLILDTGVINIRKFTSYHVELSA
jgi:hypothetical protein